MKRPMKIKNLKQTISFNASPETIYSILMDSKRHGKLTGGKATISKKVNGKFSVYDGYAHGKNVELIEGKKIVQTWHFDEAEWPEDHFSICIFNFSKKGKGCQLEFEQIGIPAAHYESLKKGWHTYYWSPLKEQFN